MMTSFPTDQSNRRTVRPGVLSTNVTLDSSASHISFIVIGQLSKRCQKNSASITNEKKIVSVLALWQTAVLLMEPECVDGSFT